MLLEYPFSEIIKYLSFPSHAMASYSIEHMFATLKLMDDEVKVGELSAPPQEAFLINLRTYLCLIGVVLSDNVFNILALHPSLMKSWHLRKGFGFRQVAKNLLVFQFFLTEDKKQVMKGGIWCFDHQLVLLKEM